MLFDIITSIITIVVVCAFDVQALPLVHDVFRDGLALTAQVRILPLHMLERSNRRHRRRTEIPQEDDMGLLESALKGGISQSPKGQVFIVYVHILFLAPTHPKPETLNKKTQTPKPKP